MDRDRDASFDLIHGQQFIENQNYSLPAPIGRENGPDPINSPVQQRIDSTPPNRISMANYSQNLDIKLIPETLIEDQSYSAPVNSNWTNNQNQNTPMLLNDKDEDQTYSFPSNNALISSEAQSSCMPIPSPLPTIPDSSDPLPPWMNKLPFSSESALQTEPNLSSSPQQGALLPIRSTDPYCVADCIAITNIDCSLFPFSLTFVQQRLPARPYFKTFSFRVIDSQKQDNIEMDVRSVTPLETRLNCSRVICILKPFWNIKEGGQFFWIEAWSDNVRSAVSEIFGWPDISEQRRDSRSQFAESFAAQLQIKVIDRCAIVNYVHITTLYYKGEPIFFS